MIQAMERSKYTSPYDLDYLNHYQIIKHLPQFLVLLNTTFFIYLLPRYNITQADMFNTIIVVYKLYKSISYINGYRIQQLQHGYSCNKQQYAFQYSFLLFTFSCSTLCSFIIIVTVTHGLVSIIFFTFAINTIFVVTFIWKENDWLM